MSSEESCRPGSSSPVEEIIELPAWYFFLQNSFDKFQITKKKNININKKMQSIQVQRMVGLSHKYEYWLPTFNSALKI